MAFRLFLRSTSFHLHLGARSFFTTPTQTLFKEKITCFNNDVYNLSPLLPHIGVRNCKIDLVDDATWNVSSGLAEAWANAGGAKALPSEEDDDEDEATQYLPPNRDDSDLDEIEDMRVQGSLFYKLEKNSIEYQDHTFDFHGKKPKEKKEQKKKKKVVKNGKGRNEITKKEAWTFKSHDPNENLGTHSIMDDEDVRFSDQSDRVISRYDKVDGFNTKTKRAPSFYQVTGPYHEPFCLDIYLTKGSVRASVIHRATSKVVAVAHSISKDLKFDLISPKCTKACALVGKVLAQRAMDDDIHNMVYTPRKGEKMEGKLQIVLQTIIDGGIKVNVKLKQKKARNH